MRALTISKCKLMLSMGSMVLFLLISGCEEDGQPDVEGKVVSLNQIQDNPDYALLSLTGTPWKLIGFVDQRRSRIRLAEPALENSYRLVFHEDGSFSGSTYVNGAGGTYKRAENGNGLTILQFGLMTFAGELYDSPLYVESMKKVYALQISPKGLTLYYGGQKYLLFRPVNETIDSN